MCAGHLPRLLQCWRDSFRVLLLCAVCVFADQAIRPLTLPRVVRSGARGLATGSDPYDVVVIGGGPGGYVSAIKAAQLGLRTACVENRGALGGTCLNVGCIPSKSLLNNSHIYHSTLHDIKRRGIDVGDVKLNLPVMLKAKQDSVTALTKGVEGLFKKNKVDYVKGTGSFSSPTTVSVDLLEGGTTELEAKNIIIATGSEVSTFPGLEIDEDRVVSSTGALSLPEVPKRFVVVGGGVIGLEMSSVWSRLGSDVTVVEFQNSIGGPGVDGEIAKAFKRTLEKQGIKFRLGTKLSSIDRQSDKVVLNLEEVEGGKTEQVEADRVLLSIGRRPVTRGLNLEAVGIETDNRGRIVVDDQYNTTCKGVKCIGDATFGPMLAHKAEDEGIAAAEIIKTGHGHVNYDVIPSVIYTYPEVAWVGRTEEQVKQDGVEYKVGKFPFLANSRAKTNMESEGQVKFVVEKETDRVLGIHIMGPNAGEMIAEGALAMEYSASAEDIARTCHAHPTLSEAFKEAALASFSKPINF